MRFLDDAPQVLQPDVWSQLESAREDYLNTTKDTYDEVLFAVQERVASAGSVGKVDIGALVVWKRLNASTPWAKDLMNMPDTEVREYTASAVQAVNDLSLSVPVAARQGRSALAKVPGCRTGDALASALLLAAAPARMAVYDRRAQAGLELLGLVLTPRPRRYERYMAIVEQLRTLSQEHGPKLSARDIDTSLYQLGGPSEASRREERAEDAQTGPE